MSVTRCVSTIALLQIHTHHAVKFGPTHVVATGSHAEFFSACHSWHGRIAARPVLGDACQSKLPPRSIWDGF